MSLSENATCAWYQQHKVNMTRLSLNSSIGVKLFRFIQWLISTKPRSGMAVTCVLEADTLYIHNLKIRGQKCIFQRMETKYDKTRINTYRLLILFLKI